MISVSVNSSYAITPKGIISPRTTRQIKFIIKLAAGYTVSIAAKRKGKWLFTAKRPFTSQS